MDVVGQIPIHPFLFYSGKTSGFLTWLGFIPAFFRVSFFVVSTPPLLRACSGILAGIGVLLMTLSFVHLGSSARVGLPVEETAMESGGIYRFSRNPMYVGAHLVTLAAMIITAHIAIAILGLYSFVVYHLIILAEEIFLEKRFGNDYVAYKKKVRRYF